MLRYKQKRQIINTAYQKTPDNIVGKMTTSRLDEELLQVERTSRRGVLCGGGATALSSAAAVDPVKAPTPPHHFPGRFNAKLSIVIQQTQAAKAFNAVSLAFELVRRARELMAPFAIDFRARVDEFFYS